LLRVHPDSLVGWMSQGGQRPAQVWLPLLHLVWLLWMVAAPWLVKPYRGWVVAITLASLLPFLLLYHRAWYGPRQQLVACIAAIALMGLAMVPVNSSWSYVIYAATMIPFATRGWRTAGWLTLLLAAFVAVALASGWFSPAGAVMAAAMTAAIAVLNIVYRHSQERDAALRLTQDEVRRLATTAERERIARDLHDLLGHTWSLVAVKAELARKLVSRDAAAAERELADIERVARQSLAQVREAVAGMRAPALAAELASARLMLEAAHIGFEQSGLDQAPALAPQAEAALAMGLREAVTNVQRHARASHVQVRLQADGPDAELSVHDNGRGTGTGADTGASARRGNGLAGMQERLAALGGTLLLESAPGQGTLLRMRVPKAQQMQHGPALTSQPAA
jgi:two-component system sensor histidine kinase DesK